MLSGSAGASLIVAALAASTWFATVDATSPGPTLVVEPGTVLEGVPSVGNNVSLRVPLELHATPDLAIHLHASDLVTIRSSPSIELEATQGPDGLVAILVWPLRIEDQGLWTLQLSATTASGEDYPFADSGIVVYDPQRKCCGAGWSTTDGGAWALDGKLQPPFEPSGEGSINVTDHGTKARLEYHPAPVGVAGQAILVDVTIVPGGIGTQPRPPQGWLAFVDVPDGGTTEILVQANYSAPFPAASGVPPSGTLLSPWPSLGGQLHCEVVRVAREGDRSWLAARWPCDAPAPDPADDLVPPARSETATAEPGDGPSAEAKPEPVGPTIPAAGWLAAPLLAAAAFLRRRVKG